MHVYNRSSRECALLRDPKCKIQNKKIWIWLLKNQRRWNFYQWFNIYKYLLSGWNRWHGLWQAQSTSTPATWSFDPFPISASYSLLPAPWLGWRWWWHREWRWSICTHHHLPVQQGPSLGLWGRQPSALLRRICSRQAGQSTATAFQPTHTSDKFI